jgi:hypothetical protein
MIDMENEILKMISSKVNTEGSQIGEHETETEMWLVKLCL